MVDILLSAYNGEKYIKEQIESILNQTYKKWRLLIRDDGSTDKTLEILRSYMSDFPYNNIIIIRDGDGHLGPSMSFIRLLNY